MIRAAPGFWGRPPGLAADLLLPLGAAWDFAGRLRRAWSRPYRAPVPVVCVGNLVAGGAGKTPVALALSRCFAGHGVAVHIVSRGYGGRLRGPVLVDPTRHDAAAVGDEALLLARQVRCWIARDRAAGVAAAAAGGAGAIVLDDGFQNPAVVKSLALIVVDAAYGFGNRRVMPAGPLREGLERGLARADAIVLLRGEAAAATAAPLALGGALPVVPAELVPVDGERLAGARVFAFAGIGRPQKFFAMLRIAGAELVGAKSFPDHHPFRPGEIARLRRAAARAGARLVTTAKDFVRLAPAERRDIEVFEVEIRWTDKAALAGLIGPVMLSALRDGCDPDEHCR